MDDTKKNRYKELLALRDSRGWDNKDWSRAISINQRTLQYIEQGLIDVNDEMLAYIDDATRNESCPDLMRFDKPIVIAFDIHKGGGGKSTLAVNMSFELGRRGYNVLVVDADSQGDSTTTLLSDKNFEELQKKNLYECMTEDSGKRDIRKGIFYSNYDRLDVVPANTKLSKMDVYLSSEPFSEQVFRESLEGVIKDNYYDFVIVDMDKNLGLLNTTILCACDYIMIPVECGMYHLKGLTVMREQHSRVRKSVKDSDLEILGIVFNKVETRKKILEEARKTVDEMFPGLRFNSMIRVDANVGNSQWEHVPLGTYSRSTRAFKEISELTDEALDRIEKRRGK